jgi:hypothetical protein
LPTLRERTQRLLDFRKTIAGMPKGTQRDFTVPKGTPFVKAHVHDEATPAIINIIHETPVLAKQITDAAIDDMRVEVIGWVEKEIKWNAILSRDAGSTYSQVLLARKGTDFLELSTRSTGKTSGLEFARKQTIDAPSHKQKWSSLEAMLNHEYTVSDIKYNLEYHRGEPPSLPHPTRVTREGFEQVKLQRRYLQGVMKNRLRYQERVQWFADESRRLAGEQKEFGGTQLQDSTLWRHYWWKEIRRSIDARKRAFDPDYRMPIVARQWEQMTGRAMTPAEYEEMERQLKQMLAGMERQNYIDLRIQRENEKILSDDLFLIVGEDDPDYDLALNDVEVAEYLGLDWLDPAATPPARIDHLDEAISNKLDKYFGTSPGQVGVAAGRMETTVDNWLKGVQNNRLWRYVDDYARMHPMGAKDKREFMEAYSMDKARYEAERRNENYNMRVVHNYGQWDWRRNAKQRGDEVRRELAKARKAAKEGWRADIRDVTRDVERQVEQWRRLAATEDSFKTMHLPRARYTGPRGYAWQRGSYALRQGLPARQPSYTNQVRGFDFLRSQAKAVRQQELALPLSQTQAAGFNSAFRWQERIHQDAEKGVAQLFSNAIVRSERRFSAGFSKMNNFPSAVPHLGLTRNWAITGWDLAMTFLPPSTLYKYIGQYADLVWFLEGTITMANVEAYMMAWARGSAGVTKKVQRRKLRRSIWYGD